MQIKELKKRIDTLEYALTVLIEEMETNNHIDEYTSIRLTQILDIKKEE